MAHATDIAAYQYRAAHYCPACIIYALPSEYLSPAARDMRAEDVLEQVAAYIGIDRMDAYSYDSDDFPKVVFVSQIEDAETCDICHDEL